MEGIAPSVTRIVESTGLRKRLLLGTAPVVWNEAVGPEIARHTRVEKVRNGVVFVSTDHPVWSQELGLLKIKIIDQLNEKLGEPVVEDLRFRAAGLGDKKYAPRNPLRPSSVELQRVELKEALQRKIEDFASSVPDEELRRSLINWSVKMMKLQEWEKRHPLKHCLTCGKSFRSRGKECPHCKAETSSS